jgi:hypothetical protein
MPTETIYFTAEQHKAITLEAAQKKTTFAKIVTMRCFSPQPPEAPAP